MGGTNDAGTLFKLNPDGTGYAVLYEFGQTLLHPDDPLSALALGDDGAFYGTSASGGAYGGGTIFRIKRDGTEFSILHSFRFGTLDGRSPIGNILIRNGVIYGTTCYGGTYDQGSLFGINTNGSGYATLHTFNPGLGEGGAPLGGLIDVGGGVLFGTTSAGGANGGGTIFKIKTDGTGFGVVHNFTGYSYLYMGPQGGLIKGLDGSLYGTSEFSGEDRGIVFKLNTDGAGYAVLCDFTGGGGDDGWPNTSLIQAANGVLFGIARGGDGLGEAFRLNSDGSGFASIHHFNDGGGDGSVPGSALVQGTDGCLYGATQSGGTNNTGMVYKIGTNGMDYHVLHDFAAHSDPTWNPGAWLLPPCDSMLYGVTCSGGVSNAGTVFKLSVDGAGYSVIHDFGVNNSDGANPQAGPFRAAMERCMGLLREAAPNRPEQYFEFRPMAAITGLFTTSFCMERTVSRHVPSSPKVVAGPFTAQPATEDPMTGARSSG